MTTLLKAEKGPWPLALGVLMFCQAASAQPQPTATEIFHLRTECMHLGEQILAGNSASETINSFNSKYDEKINRCYVLIIQVHIKEHAKLLTLYDGQGGGLIAQWTSTYGFVKGQQVSPPIAFDYIQNTMHDAMVDQYVK